MDYPRHIVARLKGLYECSTDPADWPSSDLIRMWSSSASHSFYGRHAKPRAARPGGQSWPPFRALVSDSFGYREMYLWLEQLQEDDFDADADSDELVDLLEGRLVNSSRAQDDSLARPMTREERHLNKLDSLRQQTGLMPSDKSADTVIIQDRVILLKDLVIHVRDQLANANAPAAANAEGQTMLQALRALRVVPLPGTTHTVLVRPGTSTEQLRQLAALVLQDEARKAEERARADAYRATMGPLGLPG